MANTSHKLSPEAPGFVTSTTVLLRSTFFAPTALSTRHTTGSRSIAPRRARWLCDSAAKPLSEKISTLEEPKVRLSQTTIDIVKSTIPILQEHGFRIAETFYKTLFTNYPGVRHLFNVDRQRGGTSSDDGVPVQLVALTRSLLAFAKNVDRLTIVQEQIERICEKHVSRAVEPAHYAAVGESYLAAMKAELGNAATPEIVDAWQDAFGVLAGLYMQREAQLKKMYEERAGYFGFVDMVVEKIDSNSPRNRKIALKPVNFEVPRHEPGQFVSISVERIGEEPTMTSMKITDSETDTMWIEIPKSKERSSIYLLEEVDVGDILKVSVPCGSFSA